MPDPQQPVSFDPEKANQYYTAYQQTLQHSKDLDHQFDALQEEIERLPVSYRRDSLIAASGDLSAESIREWQRSQQYLTAARVADPAVEDRMGVASANETENSAVTVADDADADLPVVAKRLQNWLHDAAQPAGE